MIRAKHRVTFRMTDAEKKRFTAMQRVFHKWNATDLVTYCIESLYRVNQVRIDQEIKDAEERLGPKKPATDSRPRPTFQSAEPNVRQPVPPMKIPKAKKRGRKFKKPAAPYRRGV